MRRFPASPMLPLTDIWPLEGAWCPMHVTRDSGVQARRETSIRHISSVTGDNGLDMLLRVKVGYVIYMYNATNIGSLQWRSDLKFLA